MKTLVADSIPNDQLDQLEAFARQQTSPEMKDVLLALSRCIRDGSDVVVRGGTKTVLLTPAEVADRLGMSRTHVYKLLDRGEIPFERVGRDRRIHLEDLAAYEFKRQSARRVLAEQFARQNSSEADAISELADLL